MKLRPKKLRYCFVCRKVMRDQYPRTNCLDCSVTVQQIHEAHKLDLHCEADWCDHEGRSARLDHYASIVADGGRLFEESH